MSEAPERNENKTAPAAPKKRTPPEMKTLPMLPLRGMVVFPYMIIHLDVGRERSLAALEKAMMEDHRILLVCQIDADKDDPGRGDLYNYGTVAVINQILKLPGGTVRVLVEGEKRARISDYHRLENYDEVEAKVYTDPIYTSTDVEVATRSLIHRFEDWVKLSKRIPADTLVSVAIIDDAGRLADLIASHLNLKVHMRQDLLECINIRDRLELLSYDLSHEIELLRMERNIDGKVRQQMDKAQRDYYLREQIKVIRKELGYKDDIVSDIAEYRTKLAVGGYPERVQEVVNRELHRLEGMNNMNTETSVIRNYVEWLLALPWNKESKDTVDVKKAAKILDHDHYGLQKVKERILELLAVRKLNQDVKGQIICLVGPPGVGKTSIAHSIAECMDRKFARMSLGGVHDEAEIRGHRRTYIGAMPGRIISAITTAKSTNPVILLDEIDKLAGDYKGDPSSALLEVLDPEQNRTFKDNYLDIPFDLSEVLFITTANDASTIPGPLYDRMDVIELPSYTRTEKFNIAKRHLLPKQLKNNGLEGRVTLTGSALYAIIDGYTREAGVRNLERTITSVLRKCAQKIAAGEAEKISVSAAMVKELLGPEKVKPTFISRKDAVGIANGLAWTSVGGEMLPVEVAVIPNGTGKIEITGSLGDVMKESAQLAVTYAKVHAEEYGITPDKFKNTDLHIHAPEGAVPKDGPSAGVTLTTALISALSGIPVNHDLAMTGEITLHGNVLPIGGLKEKSMAAFREGISTVLIPRDNASDLYEVDAEVKEKVRFIPVGTLSEVLKHALVRPGRTPARAVRGVPQATSLIANDKPAEGHKEPAAVM